MTVWGVECHIEAGQPVVTALAVDGPRLSASGSVVFHLRSAPIEDRAQQLRSLAAAFETQLSASLPSAVVIRSIDWNRFTKETTTRPRYQVEGVLLAAARRHVELVEAAHGRAIGDILGYSKAAAEAEAAERFGGEHMQAGSAALAALVRAGEA